MRSRRFRKAIHVFTLVTFLYGFIGVHLTHPRPHQLFDFLPGHGPPSAESAEMITHLKTHTKCNICTLLVSLQFFGEPRAEIDHFTIPSPLLVDTLSIDISSSFDESSNPRAPPLDAS